MFDFHTAILDSAKSRSLGAGEGVGVGNTELEPDERFLFPIERLFDYLGNFFGRSENVHDVDFVRDCRERIVDCLAENLLGKRVDRDHIVPSLK